MDRDTPKSRRTRARFLDEAVMVIASNVAAFGLARVTERHYRALGNWLLKLAGPRARPATA